MRLKQTFKVPLLFASLVSASLFCSAPAVYSQGDTRYITDILYVPLRSGQGNEYRIVNKGLRSGTQLTFIAEGDTDEWIKVRTTDGVEGWIRSQYLQSEETANRQLSRTQAELAQLQATNNRLSKEAAELREQVSTLTASTDASQSAQAEMAAELQEIKTLSAGAIDMGHRYTELLQQHQLLQTENDVLTAENEGLKSDTSIKYMLYGAGLVLLGVLLALILPVIIPRKRHSEWR